jgi:hypothetical protein
MNEHIRKCCDGAGLDSNWKPGFDSIYGQQLEKFAELIIEECAQVASDWVNEPTMLSIENKIKWRFGVK